MGNTDVVATIKKLLIFTALMAFSAVSAGQTLTGSVSLPTGESAANNMTIRVSIELQNGPTFHDDVIISKNEDTANYKVDYQNPTNSRATVWVACINDCGGYAKDRRRYLNANGYLSIFRVRVIVPATYDFELARGSKITGTVSLPVGEKAQGNMTIRLEATAERYSSFSGSPLEVVIKSGENKADYELDYISDTQAESYFFRSYCLQNCGNYIPFYGEFAQPDGTASVAFARLDELPNSFDFNVIPFSYLAGSVSLPNGALATQDTQVEVGLRAFVDGSVERFSSVSVTIKQGENSATYQAPYGPVGDGGSYEVHSRCEAHCGEYVPDIKLYADPNGSFSVHRPVRFRDGLPDEVDLELIPGITVSGSVGLSAGSIANEDMVIEVSILTEGLYGNDTFVTLKKGDNSVDYDILYLPEDNGRYRFLAKCIENCDAILDDFNTLAAQNDGTASNTIGFISDVPDGVDFKFPLSEANEVQGTVSLPGGQTASRNTHFDVIIRTYDKDGNFVTGSRRSTSNSQIESGKNSVDYQLTYIEENGGSYEIYVHCDGRCGKYFRHPIYLQADGSLSPHKARVSEIPDIVNFELLVAPRTIGTMRLPNGATANKHILYEVTVVTYDANGDVLFSATSLANHSLANAHNSLAAIDPGSNDGEFQIRYLIEEGGSYEIFSLCAIQCEGYSTDVKYYLQSDDTYSINAEKLNEFPVNLELELLAVEEPGDIEPDTYEDDDDHLSASALFNNQEQTHSIHEAGDQDWVRFTVKEGDSDFKIEALSADATDGSPSLVLYSEDLVEIGSSVGTTTNNGLSRIIIRELPAGIYFVRIESYSGTSTISSYRLKLEHGSKDDTLCFPLKAADDSITLVCM